jgi:TPP-dependent 2-oxoacid decarboxylase
MDKNFYNQNEEVTIIKDLSGNEYIVKDVFDTMYGVCLKSNRSVITHMAKDKVYRNDNNKYSIYDGTVSLKHVKETLAVSSLGLTFNIS